MNSYQIDEFIKVKEKRQTLLNKRKEQLELLDLDLFGSKFGRFFGTSYLWIKRILTLLVGLAFVLFALLILIYPEFLLEDPSFKKEMIVEYKKDFAEIAGMTISDSFEKLLLEENPNIENVIRTIDKSFDSAIEKKILEELMYLGVLFIMVGLVFIYISRMTRNTKRRNIKLSKAESLTQGIISDYMKTIEEEEKELALFKELANRMEV
jgi:hypothetical protein